MTKQQEFKQWVEKQIEYYKPSLDINLQKILVKYNDKTDYLSITNVYPYLEPYIEFSDKAVDEWKKGNLLKDRILHELCHILTDPLYNKSIRRFVGENEILDERERLTDKITIILNNLIK